MSKHPITFSVFTKPWKTLPLAELGQMVKRLGFDAIELPVRDGFQVAPGDIANELPAAHKLLADLGVGIASVATTPTPQAIAVCGKLGIPILRVMVQVGREGYLASEARAQHEYEALGPALRDAGVKLGVQNHNGEFVCNAMGLRHLLDPLDPATVGAVLDVAHTALNGEDIAMALDIVWKHLCMVNFKNAFWQRTNGPEADEACWEVFWTSGRQGLASWPRTAKLLQQRAYTGVICLTAEYTDEPAVDRLIAKDITYAQSLFEGQATL